MERNRSIHFIELSAFSADRRVFFKTDDDFRQFQTDLCKDPAKGDIIQGTGGFRKIRWYSTTGKGKSSGCRVIYLYLKREQRIYLALVFGKNEQSNITDQQKNMLKKQVEFLKEDDP